MDGNKRIEENIDAEVSHFLLYNFSSNLKWVIRSCQRKWFPVLDEKFKSL